MALLNPAASGVRSTALVESVAADEADALGVAVASGVGNAAALAPGDCVATGEGVSLACGGTCEGNCGVVLNNRIAADMAIKARTRPTQTIFFALLRGLPGDMELLSFIENDNCNMMEKNQMSFWEHLDELRARLVTCLWIFFVGFIGFYFFSERLLDFLRKPLFTYLPPERQHLYYTGLFENFFVHLQLAAYGSLFFLSPIFFSILWRFVAPGLHPHERKKVLPFVVAASVFFLIGAGFAYFVLFPAGVKYFLSYGTEAEVAWLTLGNYVSLVLKILTGFGIAFELPVLIVLFAKIGFITAEKLEKHRRIAIIAIAMISAVVAPPDALSMLMLMAPLYLLFEGSIITVKIIQQKRSNATKSH